MDSRAYFCVNASISNGKKMKFLSFFFLFNFFSREVVKWRHSHWHRFMSNLMYVSYSMNASFLSWWNTPTKPYYVNSPYIENFKVLRKFPRLSHKSDIAVIGSIFILRFMYTLLQKNWFYKIGPKYGNASDENLYSFPFK